MRQTKTSENTTNDMPVYEYLQIRKDCLKLFGVTTSTFDGVTADMDTQNSYTIQEVQDTINNWLKKEVN